MQHLTLETELDAPDHRLFFLLPAIAVPGVMEPPFLTLLLDLARLVVDHTGDRTTPRKEQARPVEAIGEVLHMQIRDFIGATLARTRDDIPPWVDGLHIPSRHI